METRDRVISLVVVAGIIGGIWWAGSKLRSCAGGDGEATDGAPESSAHPHASASATPHATASVSANVSASADAGIAAAAPLSGTCRAIADATAKKLDDAKKARACTPAFDVSALACKTSSNSATWGLRVDDVIDLGAAPTTDGACATGWLVRLVHVDVNGVESAIVPGLSSTLLAHTYDVSNEAFSSLSGREASALSIGDATFFDWNGDGEDEVFVRGARTSDHVIDERAGIWTFPASTTSTGHITPYAPSSSFTITGVRDIDADGRPDLLVALFGTGKDAPPTTKHFAAHSLADGTFTLHDAPAIAFAQQQCPSEPALDLAHDTSADFDATLADTIACALVWGHDVKDVASGIAKACRAPSEAGACPSWAQRIATSKPPLSLR